MHDLNSRYALQTDLYQLTMAYGYWKSGRARKRAVFQLSYRRAPFGGAYAVAAGLQQAVEFLEGFHFEAEELAYLGGLRGADAQPLFRAGRLVGQRPSLRAARERCAAELARFPAQVLALEEPAEHPVGLDPRLRAQRDALVSAARDPHKKHDSKLEHIS